jgi:ribosome-associated toxin RatA of RatAB toxin-antitoxin module
VSQRKVLSRPADVVYEIVAGVEEYPQFLPWCSVASIDSRCPANSSTQAHAAPPGNWAEVVHCLVDFNFGQFAGIPSESLGGALHEEIEHNVWLLPGRRVLSVALDTQFCERICYDWQLSETSDGHTVVELDFEIVFRSLVHVPAWDLFAKGVVSRVTDAFVQRVDAVVTPVPDCVHAEPQHSAVGAGEIAMAADRPNAVAAAANGAQRPELEPLPEIFSAQSARLPRPADAAPAAPAPWTPPTTMAPPPPPPPGNLPDRLVFGASSWLLNTTASVVGVPLRVVPAGTAGATDSSPAALASARGGLPEDAAVRAALRRQPRVELIKELQVLERRVAALKSALREQPPAERPKSERW